MREVYFLVLPSVLSLDVTGPAEALTIAGAYRLHYIGPQAEVATSTGLYLGRIAPLPSILPDGCMLVIPGVDNSAHQLLQPAAQQARRWLQTLQPQLQAGKIELVCICAGALLAATAGLLAGYRCTTHHNLIEQLKSHSPTALVKENRIFVEDRGIFTSAGISAGIDLALHLIVIQLGAPQAIAVAREMVVYFRRGGDDPQLSPWLHYRNHLHPALHRAQDLLTREPEADWQLEQLAARVYLSSRHLTRLFREHLGLSVREYHEQLRLAVAGQRLQQGMGREQAALAAGFTSARQLRRAQERWQ